MRYLITGANGQLGYDVMRELDKRGIVDYEGIDIEDVDITDKEAVFTKVKEYKPDVIIHCAAFTAVDIAEKKHDLAHLINVIGTKNLAEASMLVDAKLMYMSTDYVFDGTKEGLYVEDDKANPMSVYGKTKYEGEQEVRKNPKHFITRISWVFGINGKNFIKTMLNLSETKDMVSVVNDQVGSPTYTVDLAKVLIDMSETDKYGTYHVNNDGYCSWAEFAKYIFESNNKETLVNPVSTEDYINMIGPQAYRPRNSKLSKEKLVANGFEMLPTWQDATDRFCKELENEKVLTKRR